MQDVLIAGASRGIGLELAVQYAAEGWHVIAGCRQPDEVRAWLPADVDVQALDVMRVESVAALAWHCDDAPLPLLVISAGLAGPAAQRFLAPGDAEFDAVMRTNVLGAMRLIQAFAPAVAQARGRVVVLSSDAGSLQATADAGQPLYRMACAALNMVVRMAAAEFGPRGVTVVSVHPGSVRTDMGGAGAELPVGEAVERLRQLIDTLDTRHNGRFLSIDGRMLDW
ncbi:SDR family oxidoreductase [Uliginosibacterium sp. sgz301328]|uniref:SDR family oxidoreductase n=1 Tax=Uliginosibacterium sp. sgz301328 TaxID=3243764 RepID=UPI00359D9ABE